MTSPGRNDPCPCGSGKKYKRCCGINRSSPPYSGSAQLKPDAVGGRADADRTIQRDKATRLIEAQRVYQLGNALAAQGQLDQAVVHFQRALALKPDYAEACHNLGAALAAQGQLDQAVVHFQRALALTPDNAETHVNLGMAFQMQGQADQAITHYERALALKPDYAEAHNNLGNTLAAQGRVDRAIAHYERALALKPGYAEAHVNLGIAFRTQGRVDRAITHYERALALKPGYAEAHNNLGVALVGQGDVRQAISHYERALALRPDYVTAHDNLLLALNYASANDPVAVYEAHLNFARRCETPFIHLVQAHPNIPSGERRLKIGYVSSDFRQHSVAHFIEPVFEHHDHDRFEIFCYSNNLYEDKLTERLISHADHWRRIATLSDELAAKQIRADRIDILIDLNGHMAQNRLLVFARKPAPVQVTWLGYPNTTGLSGMDYRLTDGYADPVGMTESLHSEKLIRLPECFSCYQPPQDAPAVSALPAQEKGYVTFGSFNTLAKITPEVTAVWAQILQTVAGSRLILKNLALDAETVRTKVWRTFADLGVRPDRLELLGQDRSQSAHLERYGSIDIGLDPFPYNGTTTTCEALWMGVPVVTLAGRVHAGRVGISQLSNLGLTELICHTPQQYIAAALQWATDLEHLIALRAELRARMAASPLTDGQCFTRNLEQAYREMWRVWCDRHK